ncbi:hypothetical protein PVAND_011601 [Polypedilum vanderplanki]|uniref:Phospholipid/glycerol acyltransferase domain-containing protein n=1 Tax=Polypedilum vanderplanki TaxID=319348 RepID=A0A9J6CJR8_POLVA|nr:hypothetical protein PVAND_011601 [Polypedilum vanderplanki]
MATSNSKKYLENYHNYLDKRVTLFTKPFDPLIPIKRNRRVLPEELKFRVLKSQHFNNYLDKISDNKNDRQQKETEAMQILTEIGFDRKILVIRSLGTVIDKLMAQLYKNVFINEQSIERLKAIMGRQQIIYLPSHRSYVDFMLMSYVCFSYNLEIPAIAAGMDFHSMFGLGELLRKTGAFFMRRTFGDEFYWNIFKEYMHEIITYNDFGVEFFIEGTRSRTCKALWPKTGLLSMALEPFFMGEIYDIKVVPTSISYEKVLEEQLFVYELLGIPKPKESTKGFFKAVKNLIDKNYGNMYFDFCEPISLNDFLGNKVDRFRHASEPAHIQKLNNDELVLITDFAHHVIREQQKKIVISTYNLIALIYNQYVFLNSTESLTINVLQNEIELYLKFFEVLGAIVAIDDTNLIKSIHEAMQIHDNILEIVGEKSIRLKKANTLATRQNNGLKLKGHWLCKEMMDIAVPVFSLQLYCNPTMFWLSQPAIFVFSLIGRQNVKIEWLKKSVMHLRNIFIYELVLYPRFADEDFEKTYALLEKLQIICKIDDETVSLTHSPYINILLSAISPFFNSYLQTTQIIFNNFKEKKFASKEIFIAVQSILEHEMLKGNFSIHPYALCLETITTTLLSLCNIGCLFKEKQDSVNQYSVHAENMSSLVDELKQYNSNLTFVYKYFNTLISSKI